jgi:uncharacterized protein YbjT (DUF2867 family)
MRVLLTGAAGLIGSAVAARLHAAGHEIVAVTRTSDAAAAALVVDRRITIDMARATRPEDWLPYLERIDAVINCAGVLQDSPRDSTAGVHLHGTSALFRAAVAAKVKRIIHVSAVGVEREPPTAFSQTKHAADAVLMGLDIDWLILRPSVVLGRAAYGGSALFRGFAALPVLPVVPDTGPLQVVHLDDLVATILFFLNPAAPARHVVQIVGPERYSVTDVVQIFRRWLGWRPAGAITVPAWFATLMFRLGDAVSFLGWRPPVRSTARREVTRGAVGDPSQWTRLTGITPRALPAALASEPASVQERWFAKLYLLKPLIFGVLVVFWVATGLITLGPGWEGRWRERVPCLARHHRRLPRRYRDRHRYRVPQRGAARALGRHFSVACLRGARHCHAAAPVGRPPRPHVEDLADHRAARRGAGHPRGALRACSH